MRMSIVAATAFLLVGSPAVRADTFDLTATLTSGQVTGTVTINTAGGFLTGGDLVYDNAALGVSDEDFSLLGFKAFANYQLGVLSSTEGGEFFLYFPPTSLVGYTGGSLCTTVSDCGGYSTELRANEGSDPGNVIEATAAVLTEMQPAPSSTTPEPSSFALLGTGLLGIAGAMRRRRNSA